MGEGGGEDWELPYPTFHLLYGPSRVAQATAKPVQEPSLFTCHSFHFALFATRTCALCPVYPSVTLFKFLCFNLSC